MEADDEEQPLLRPDLAVKKLSLAQTDSNVQASPSGNWKACAFILATELSECLAFAGIARNLLTYLTGELQESNAAALADYSTWVGTCFLTPLAGAFLADSYWGRYKTIVVFLSVYILGMITLALSAAPLPVMSSSMGIRRAVVFLGLYLAALGVGGIKPCVSPFGAEQFDPGEKDAKASFFNWYYFSVNIGALLATTVLVWVQDRVSWWLGFGIPAAVMAVALAMFVGSKNLYRLHNRQIATASPLIVVCQVAVAAVRKRGVHLPACDYSCLLHDKLPPGHSYKIEHTDEFSFLDKAAVIVSPGSSEAATTTTTSGWSLCTVTQVEQVKMLLRLCTVWPTVLFFFTVLAQVSSTFLEQGATMDNRIGPFTVPPATLSSVEIVSVLLSVPAYETAVLPLARRVTGKDRGGITQLQRIGVGLALATLTMAYMALLETKRLQAAPSSVSIIWQAPAYFVLGAAEMLTSAGLIEFFYDQSPDAMKSQCTAMSLLAVAAGSYLNSAIVAVVARVTTWIPQDLDQGRLDCFFWMMAILSTFNMLAFLWASMRYKYGKNAN